MEEKEENCKKILLILIGRLGDYIITTAFLEGLRKHYPDAKITFITSNKSANLALKNPNLDEVVVFKGWHNLLSIINTIFVASKKYDFVIDLNPAYSRASIFFVRLAKADRKITFEKKSSEGVYTDFVPQNMDSEHFMDKYVSLANYLGFTPPANMIVHISKDAILEAKKIISSFGFPENNLVIAIHAGNFKKFGHRWPEEKFVEFTKELLKKDGISIFYLVGPGEESKTYNGILKSFKDIKFFVPKTQELAGAILKQCDLLICNNTGTLHLAAAVGTTTFSFNTGYSEKFWKPRGENHYSIASKNHNSCRDIEVKDALEKVNSIIQKLMAEKHR